MSTFFSIDICIFESRCAIQYVRAYPIIFACEAKSLAGTFLYFKTTKNACAQTRTKDVP